MFKDGFALMAMPLFILTGDLINKSGSQNDCPTSHMPALAGCAVVWRWPRLALVVFAAISGSNSATTATIVDVCQKW